MVDKQNKLEVLLTNNSGTHQEKGTYQVYLRRISASGEKEYLSKRTFYISDHPPVNGHFFIECESEPNTQNPRIAGVVHNERILPARLYGCAIKYAKNLAKKNQAELIDSSETKSEREQREQLEREHQLVNFPI